MRKEMQQEIARYRSALQHRRKLYMILASLSLLVVVSTFYALSLPGVTMQQALICDLQEHTHSGDCYTKQQVCELANVHLHTDDCYMYPQILVCSVPEIQEGEAHAHSCDCTIQPDSPCELQENEAHTHTDACYKEPVLICQLADVEAHAHSAACYDEQPELVCTEEIPDTDHVCTDDCWETVLNCEIEQHTHIDTCYGAADEGMVELAPQPLELEQQTLSATIYENADAAAQAHTTAVAQWSKANPAVPLVQMQPVADSEPMANEGSVANSGPMSILWTLSLIHI